MPDLVRVERSGAHATLVIDHPKANAISAGVIAAFTSALDALEKDPSVRALVVTGEGRRFFAAGADVTEFPAAAAAGRPAGGGGEMCRRLALLAKPSVAAVNGIAFGGGCEIALACDIRIAAESARFGQPEINLGIIPGWGGTQRLPRAIGMSRAMRMLLTGEAIDAATALAWGLVSEVVPDDDLRAAAEALAEKLAAQAPLAVAATKRAVHEGVDKPLSHGLDVETHEFTRLFASDDASEGIAAFLDKREPRWRGR
ncbi:MAG TPA: enoyl-CoA hydratase-related protein [Candidatus Dormibacteraeota bacterium]|nr:enoyl-CoA hydratase-related protein [Candidatus Dormibacteraeota bacterium]